MFEFLLKIWACQTSFRGFFLVQGRGNYFEVGGGGGQPSPGVQGNPYPKLKTPRIWPTIFREGPKFTCKNKPNWKNMILTVQSWNGGAPTAFKLWGQVLPPPAPTSLSWSADSVVPGSIPWEAGSWWAIGRFTFALAFIFFCTVRTCTVDDFCLLLPWLLLCASRPYL